MLKFKFVKISHISDKPRIWKQITFCFFFLISFIIIFFTITSLSFFFFLSQNVYDLPVKKKKDYFCSMALFQNVRGLVLSQDNA